MRTFISTQCCYQKVELLQKQQLLLLNTIEKHVSNHELLLLLLRHCCQVWKREFFAFPLLAFIRVDRIWKLPRHDWEISPTAGLEGFRGRHSRSRETVDYDTAIYKKQNGY